VTDSDPGEPCDPDALRVVSYLWGEYQYRHDMVWKLAFRITAVAAALLIAPFLTDVSVQKAVGYGLAGLPSLAIVVIAVGVFTLESELRRLGLIRQAYRKAQAKVLRPYLSANELDRLEAERRFGLGFDQRVRVYFVVLLVASIIYFLVLVHWWLPDLVDQARHPPGA
jgi:hypothetical protein